MNPNNINKLNLLTESNKVNPNYDLSNRETYIELYVGNEKLCIIGCMDPNYICWCSITDIGDKENNARIFDHIANDKFNIFSHLYKVIDLNEFYKLQNWYHCRIIRTSEKGMLWKLPFRGYYGLENKEQHGRFFSEYISSLYDDVLKLSEFRGGGQRYVQMLEYYLDILKKEKDYNYYKIIEPLFSILEKESYLFVCPDEKTRNLYKECMRVCNELYGCYMTAVR